MNRKFITFGRILKSAAQNFIRNAWLSIAAMAVMVITLSIVLFSVVANATFTNTIAQITDKIDISVYLRDDVTIEAREGLTKQLEATANVKSVQYISKDDALESYKRANADNLDLLLAISQTDNPLPASLLVKPKDPNRIEEIRAILESAEARALQSEPISYSGDRKLAIDNITRTTAFLRKAGAVAVLISAFVSVLIIFNTIQMAIFNRRDELTIMRLLGASSWFIRGPFIAETVYYGIISSAISVLLMQAFFAVPTEAFASTTTLGLLDIKFANEYFLNHYGIIVLSQLGLGIGIGATSSFIATQRYLRFKTSK